MKKFYKYSHNFLKFSVKQVLNPNGPYINKSRTKTRNASLSIILEFCLLAMICSASEAYTNLCRGLKYLLKVMYIILNYPTVAQFWIFETLYLGRTKKLTYMSEKISKNERHLSLVAHSFT